MAIEFCIINKGYNHNYSIKHCNKDIGRISLREYRDIVYIESIFIYQSEQKKGYGKKAIDKLKLQYSYIYGCSSPLSIGFWLKMGAIFDYNVDKNTINKLMNMGEFPAFFIKSAN